MPKVVTYWGERRYIRRIPSHVLKVSRKNTPTVTICKIPYTATNPTKAQFEQRKKFALAAIGAYDESKAKIAGGPGYYEEFIAKVAAGASGKITGIKKVNLAERRKAKHAASMAKWKGE